MGWWSIRRPFGSSSPSGGFDGPNTNGTAGGMAFINSFGDLAELTAGIAALGCASWLFDRMIRAFGNSRTISEQKPRPEQTVGDVVTTYVALIAKYPLSILDTSMLPTSKAIMKVMLKSLYGQANSKEQKAFCETGFMFLSKFQDGVGATPIDGKLQSGDIKANLNANMATLSKWIEWEKLSIAETEILAAEWKRFLRGDPI
jgi:hypothetical protein